jgi:translation initiation factor 2B subunit (eIF-2B alpha/beta/delta family)
LRLNFLARQLVDGILELGVQYTLMSSLSYAMPEVKKAVIEPYRILLNNAALTPIGIAMIAVIAMIAIVAHDSGVPVIMPCPSSRFVSKVSID